MRRDIAGVQLTHNGKTMALSDWAHTLDVPYATVRMRYTRGERDPAKLLEPPPHRSLVPRTARNSSGYPNPRRFSHATLDDMFTPDVVDKLREIARQTNTPPIVVVQQIVTRAMAKVVLPVEQTS